MNSLVSILGENQGDGIPRGKLRLVGINETSDPLNEVFGTATVSIQNIGYGDLTCLVFRFKFDAKHLKKFGIGGDVVDVNNFIYRRFGLGVSNPSIGGLRDRAKKGTKELTFHYEISKDDAKRFGFNGRYGECVVLKRGA